MAVRYSPISSKLFVKNRSSLKEQLRQGGVLLMQSNDEMPRNGDCYFPFRQDSDFFYLTGIDQEESVLLLNPFASSEKEQEILFIKETNAHITIWEGSKHSKKEAREISGIQNVQWLSELSFWVEKFLVSASLVYYNKNENERASSPVPSRNERVVEGLKQRYREQEFVSVAPIMERLRVIKSEMEIELIKQACSITKGAFDQVLKVVQPGIWEYEIEAEITKEFIGNRANGHAYTPIVASGANSCVLHYIENNQQCKEGDLLLLDFGAEYANYASDLTRTIPVNGKFSARQKQVYQAVLNVFKVARKNMISGSDLKTLQGIVVDQMEKELVDLGLIKVKELKSQDKESPLYRKYFMHGVAHFMGLDVHDIGNRRQPFKDGMVLTCEPGIYIAEEGIGVRLENDIVIQGSAPIDLMSSIPIELEEIMALMRR